MLAIELKLCFGCRYNRGDLAGLSLMKANQQDVP